MIGQPDTDAVAFIKGDLHLQTHRGVPVEVQECGGKKDEPRGPAVTHRVIKERERGRCTSWSGEGMEPV